MGMSSSQANLGFLIDRKNAIGRQLTTLSNDKMMLSKDMQKVSKEYQEALNAKVLKWSNNAGITYSDLSYNNLMTPSSMNGNKPYLITDMGGRVVVDSKYQKYAEMISPNGAPGGDWESNRAEILSSLTGISADDIEKASSARSTVLTSGFNIEELKKEVEAAKDKAYNKNTVKEFCKYFGNTPDSYVYGSDNKGNSIQQDYGISDRRWSLGSTPESAKSALKSLGQTLCKNVKNYLTDEDYKKFEEACNQTCDSYVFDDKIGEETSTAAMYKDGNYSIRVDNFINQLMSAYESAGGATRTNTSNNETQFLTVDKNSAEYKAYLAAQAKLDAAVADYDSAVDTNNQIFTAEQEAQIEFYDTIFSSIAEKGWTANDNVEDSDYLNQMLQNNLYTITSVSREEECDCEKGIHKFINSYDTDIATNCSNIFQVNDSDIREQALAEYEYKKNLINSKETRSDTRMKDLETEQSAINQMIQGIESVRNDNVERTFSIFG